MITKKDLKEIILDDYEDLKFSLEDLGLGDDFSLEQLDEKGLDLKSQLDKAIKEADQKISELYSLENLRDIIINNGVNVSVMESLSKFNPDILNEEMPIGMFTEQLSIINQSYALEGINDIINTVLTFISNHIGKIIILLITLVGIFFTRWLMKLKAVKPAKHEDVIKTAVDEFVNDIARSTPEAFSNEEKETHSVDIGPEDHDNQKIIMDADNYIKPGMVELEKNKQKLKDALNKSIVETVVGTINENLRTIELDKLDEIITTLHTSNDFTAIGDMFKILDQIGASICIDYYKLYGAKPNSNKKVLYTHNLAKVINKHFSPALRTTIKELYKEKWTLCQFNTNIDNFIVEKKGVYDAFHAVETLGAFAKVLEEVTKSCETILQSFRKMSNPNIQQNEASHEISILKAEHLFKDLNKTPYTLGPLFKFVKECNGFLPESSEALTAQTPHIEYYPNQELDNFWHKDSYLPEKGRFPEILPEIETLYNRIDPKVKQQIDIHKVQLFDTNVIKRAQTDIVSRLNAAKQLASMYEANINMIKANHDKILAEERSKPYYNSYGMDIIVWPVNTGNRSRFGLTLREVLNGKLIGSDIVTTKYKTIKVISHLFSDLSGVMNRIVDINVAVEKYRNK